jgi:beta-galactosidase
MNMVRFSITGPGRIVGSGNGDPACHEPNQAAYHKAFYGHCMVLVQADRTPGVIHVTAAAKGLAPETIAIKTIRPKM